MVRVNIFTMVHPLFLVNCRIPHQSTSTFRRQNPSMAHLALSRQASINCNIQLQLSSGADEGRLTTEAIALLDCKWALDEDHMGVWKTFDFPTYDKALVILSSQQPSLANTQQDFMTLVGIECKLKNHHPEVRNVCCFPVYIYS